MIEKLLKEITKDWTEADWEDVSGDELRYHISEFLNALETFPDLFLLRYEFEEYMGWQGMRYDDPMPSPQGAQG